MAEPRAPSDDALPALPAPPEALAVETWILHPPEDRGRDALDRPEAAGAVDGLLARVARGHGALAVAVGDHFLSLGYSNLGDYAQGRLGSSPGAARSQAKLARALRSRPLLREAVRTGDVSARKAQAVLAVACGADEAGWVERARVETVRALEVAVREARCEAAARPRPEVPRAGGAEIAGAPNDVVALALARKVADETVEAAKAAAARSASWDDERWERVRIDMTEDDRTRLDRAMALAGRVLGPGAPRWERLEAICQEYLGAHPIDPTEDERAAFECRPVDAWLEGAKEALEREMNRWSFLEPVAPVEAPVRRDGDAEAPGGWDHGADPLAIDARLRELSAMRGRWDVLLGHLAMLMKRLGLWRDAGFASFSHYCEERLGLAERTVEQRAWLAERCYDLPGLREAMSSGRLGYEKARLVARVADEDSIGAWIEKARATTALDLRREIEAGEERQMCARGELEMVLPRRVRVLVDAVVRAAREAEKRWLKSGEGLGVAAAHFVATWEPLLPRRRTWHQRILERDGGRCLVPGCSRPAGQAHHVRFRSAGGGDEGWNLGSLCPPHHLHGVHMGWIRVTGEAPDRLTWWMAAPPLEA
jgi:hypothetical protein